MKKCLSCQNEYELDNFRPIKGGKIRSCCRTCYNAYIREYLRGNSSHIKRVQVNKIVYRKKLCQFKEKYGCCLCGYNKSGNALDFHHLDKSKKLFNIASGRSRSYKEIKINSEIKKCIIVCATCHREIEAGLVNDDLSNFLINEDFDANSNQHLQPKPLSKNWLCICGLKKDRNANTCLKCFRESQNHSKLIKKNLKKSESQNVVTTNKNYIKKKYYCNCGNEKDFKAKHCKFCYDKLKRKVERPTKEELEKIVWDMPTSHIAKKYGVSDNTIAKWCKSYGITKPPRGYWT